MRNKVLFIGCLLLTAIVVTTACRIEYLNVESGHFLPRQAEVYGVELEKWELPELAEVLDRVDHQIFERRQNFVMSTISDSAAPVPEVNFGAPYSESEARFRSSVSKTHASHTKLHWWISNFGVAQYALAPTSLLVAVFCAVCLVGWPQRSTASICACLSGICIVLMLTRNYWDALGA